MTNILKSKVLGSKLPLKTPTDFINLTALIGDGALAVNSKQTRLNVKFIDISLIKFDESNPRDLPLSSEQLLKGPKLLNKTLEDFEKELQQYCKEHDFENTIFDAYMNIANLAVSIGSAGNLINPITVQIDPKGGCYFYLIAGHRRALAHILLSEEKIAACVLDNINELEKSVLQWKENQDRLNLDLFEQIQNIIKIKQKWEASSSEPFSNKIVISLLKFTKAPASRMLNIVRSYEANDQFKEAVDKKLLTSEMSADIISRLESKQKSEILTAILSGKKFTKNTLQAMLGSEKANSVIPVVRNRSKSPIKAKQDVLVYGKIMKILLALPELRAVSEECINLDLKDKESSQKVWQKIIEFVRNQ